MLSSPDKSFRSHQHSLIQQLADGIEAKWKQYLQLSPYPVPEDLGYIEGSLEGERLTIENYCYRTPQFRKLHLELAQVSNGIDILHCVMFPHPEYPLPIFGVDLVGSVRGGISAAIVDLSPIDTSGILPLRYQIDLSLLPDLSFTCPRTLPEWGDIFSEFCLFVRPRTPQEEQNFLNHALQCLDIHCQVSIKEKPLSSHLDISGILAGHYRYCSRQQKNDKTRRILENSFGTEWTNRYFETMLFDASSITSAAAATLENITH